MEYNKAQEIKNNMFLLNQSRTETIYAIMDGYIWGTYGNSEHYGYDELSTLYDEMWNEHYNIPVFAPLIAWQDHLCAKRVVLPDESIKNIAINALPLIQYVTESNLTIENTSGQAKIYVNYILDEHKAIFEAFGGHVEDNPYPTSIILGTYTVEELNAFVNEHTLVIDGWEEMSKENKVASLLYVIYGI